MARQDFNIRWAQSVEGESSSTVFQNPGTGRIGTGWEGGADKDAPPAGQENWWHNRVDSALQDIERFGAMTWVPTAIYAAGAPVKRQTDGNYYESLVSSNIGQDPAATSGYWRLIGTSLYAGVPIGTTVDVAHNGVPDIGWLKCNGAVVLRSTYPRLFDRIGTTYNSGGESTTQFRLPDTRGLFVRGFDDGRGVDPGRVFGSTQNDTFQNHFHLDPTATANAPNGNLFELPYSTGIGGGFQQYDYVGSAPTTAVGNDETRPKNLSFAKWIKY